MKDVIGTTMLAAHGSGRSQREDPAALERKRRLAMGEAPSRPTFVVSEAVEAPFQKIPCRKNFKADGEPKNGGQPAWQKPKPESVAPKPNEAQEAPSPAPSQGAQPALKKGFLDIVAVLQKRYRCIDYLEAKGTALQPGHYITTDIDNNEVVVGVMVVEVLLAHPGNPKALKLRPVVSLGTWKKFHGAEFCVNSSALLYGNLASYRGKQMNLYKEFFRILERCRYGLTPVAEREGVTYTMPWEEGKVVFTVG